MKTKFSQPVVSRSKHESGKVCKKATRGAIEKTIAKSHGERFLVLAKAFRGSKGAKLLNELGKNGWRLSFLSGSHYAVNPRVV
jgi:hypothetical protein